MTMSPKMALLSVLVTTLMLMCIQPSRVNAQGALYNATTWTNATATFYGGDDGAGTMGGACGYGNMFTRGYGLETAALSTVLFNNGLTCGACFMLKCRLNESRWCYSNVSSITISATNFCPPNLNRTTDGWCNLPRSHFDLSVKMFTTLARAVGGIIPVLYKRVPCVKTGGVRFTLNGNPWFNLVLISNVGGQGNVVAAQMKGSKTAWFNMRQNWGQNWELGQKLINQTLSFRLTLGLGQTLTFNNLTTPDWKFGQTWEADTNFPASISR
ncbi:expansin [Marchantia polymorpha subsp. ruderalis]|nr:hypothetical protein MARPO_0085s0011 [Marchantia polymorpha]BBN05085.1 hypothetical protein Mp_3g10160 [Marchantia polymorpha subsp. ruderalis]|eukprot:PTQ33788.1 hypothetical protein MARPO_0085s0011 [Marchantia polymorpha]